jgi:leucyl/phenylalanyl-tRNA--protein transferase
MSSLHFLDDRIWFPPAENALDDGLLAAGGDLRPERLLAAYHKGIFPWYSGTLPLWWSPDPRFVLFPTELKVSKSLQQVIKKQVFSYTINAAFEQVIQACRQTPRPGQSGTWIMPEVEAAYTKLHRLGYAVSFESWHHGTLAGGLYGVQIGKVFFGESMFSNQSNASKTAFCFAVNHLLQQGCQLIDCQVYTEHLERFGARFIPRNEFLKLLEKLTAT